MAQFSWYHNDKKPAVRDAPNYVITNLQLRFLIPSDVKDVFELCSDCFPIDYPHSWYEEITSNPKFYSLAAVCDGTLVGLIVAEIKECIKLNREDKNIVAPCFGKSTEVGYILSLAVDKRYRRNGIASILLGNLISHLTSSDYSCCKAIFLHVLTSNSAAIQFYEHRQFRLHMFLPYYYLIEGKCKDGFTYVLYINGGHPTSGILDVLKNCLNSVCESSMVLWTVRRLTWITPWLLSGIKRIL